MTVIVIKQTRAHAAVWERIEAAADAIGKERLYISGTALMRIMQSHISGVITRDVAALPNRQRQVDHYDLMLQACSALEYESISQIYQHYLRVLGTIEEPLEDTHLRKLLKQAEHAGELVRKQVQSTSGKGPCIVIGYKRIEQPPSLRDFGCAAKAGVTVDT